MEKGAVKTLEDHAFQYDVWSYSEFPDLQFQQQN